MEKDLSDQTLSPQLAFSANSPIPPEEPEIANTALVDGVWQSDSSRHSLAGQVTSGKGTRPTLCVAARNGLPTMKVAYFFSGISRKTSIAQSLKKLCEDSGYGLEFTEIDILVGGKDHDLFDKSKQDAFLQQVEAGEYHINILSPPCCTWSRANWANDTGPKPCRARAHPWGYPADHYEFKHRAKQLRRAEDGNEFIHFSIRVIRASATARANGHFSRSLLEHPEDLGMMFNQGEPASVWQLPEVRQAFGCKYATIAFHQCMFGVDRKKPTRIFSDVLGFEKHGFSGWPAFDEAVFVAQLGAFRSRTGAVSEITSLEQAFPDQLSGAGLNIAADRRADGKNMFRIMTAGMSADEAKRLCSVLWDRMVGCMVKLVP